jgi:hypothetical protein
MLAFANPEGDIFSGNPQMDIGMRPTVMSRFALVIKVEAIKRQDMLSLFSQSLDAKGELKHLPQYFDQWLKLARSYNPELNVSLESRERYLSGWWTSWKDTLTHPFGGISGLKTTYAGSLRLWPGPSSNLSRIAIWKKHCNCSKIHWKRGVRKLSSFDRS